MPKGKFVVFRGDLGHAGAGYKQMDMRVHCYVSLKDKVQRLENETCFMRDQGYELCFWADELDEASRMAMLGSPNGAAGHASPWPMAAMHN